jgi:hypothetical protein
MGYWRALLHRSNNPLLLLQFYEQPLTAPQLRQSFAFQMTRNEPHNAAVFVGDAPSTGDLR